MASNGKRMVKEDLIKKLENLPEGLEVVEANSTDEATETLSKLTVGDTVYAVPQGGETPHLGVVKVGYSDQDNPIVIANLVSGVFTEFSNTLDESDQIVGLYDCLSRGGNIEVMYMFGNKQIYISTWYNSNLSTCILSMNVDGVTVFLATVDNEDNLTYTTLDDYFYIKYEQIF